MVVTLADGGKTLATMAPAESLWQAGASTNGVASATFYCRFRKYLTAAGLPPSGVHILRHTAAKLRREAGESIESVSQFLDHSSLAVTTIYLRRLEGQTDESWGKVAEAIGV
jgi:integrase